MTRPPAAELKAAERVLQSSFSDLRRGNVTGFPPALCSSESALAATGGWLAVVWLGSPAVPLSQTVSLAYLPQSGLGKLCLGKSSVEDWNPHQ